MIQIKLLKDWKTKKKGEIINISKKGGSQFVKAGCGEYINKKQKVVTKKKTQKPIPNSSVTDTTNTTNTTHHTNTTNSSVVCVVCSNEVLGCIFQENTMEKIFRVVATSKEALTYGKIAKELNKDPVYIRQAINRKKEYFDLKRPDGKKVLISMSHILHKKINQRIKDFEASKLKKQQYEAKIKKEEEATISKEQEIISDITNFCSAYKKDIGKQLKQGNKSIIFNFKDLSEFSINLSDELISEPEKTLELFEAVLKDFSIINYVMRIRIVNIPSDRRIFIENLRSSHIDELVMIEGRVVSITDVRPQVVNAKFECPSCGTIISVLQLEKKFREPNRCSCGRRGGFKLVKKEIIDTARIILEDLQENTDNPHTRRLNIFIKEDLTSPKNIRLFTPGNEVKIVGVLKEIPIPIPGGFSTRSDVGIEVNSVELSEEDIDITKFSEDDVENIKNLASKIDINGLEEINTSFSPEIYGNEEIKNAIILQLCNRRNVSKNGNIRNKSNILLIGDPGSAKSVLGNFAVNVTPGARKITGGGSSAVGITASVIKEEDGWRVEPGAFVLAKELLFIDELNNLQDEDKPKLQEAMSEQSVTIAKANIRMKMKVTAGALATANPVKGIFNNEEDMVKQFNLPSPIINRFDIIFVIRDIVNKSIDEAIAEKMIRREIGQISCKYSKDFLRRFFVYIRQLDEPTIGKDIASSMKSLYAKMRNYKTSSININPRFKETLIRLSKASAKIRMSSLVEEKDIERSINILSKSYYNTPSYGSLE